MQEVEIRLATEQDAKELLEIYRPYVENTAITFEYEVPTVEAFARRIQETLQKFPYLVAVYRGEIFGYTYASPFKNRAAYDWTVESSIYICQDYQKRGLGRRLYTELENIVRRQGVLNIVACIADSQEADEYLTNASIRFHEKLGYRRAGRLHQCGYKFNRWYDVVWMEKRIGIHQTGGTPIRYFRDLQE